MTGIQTFSQIKFISGNNFPPGKDPQFTFFQVVERGAEVSPDPEGSQLPLVQKNLHAEVVYFGVTYSVPLHY